MADEELTLTATSNLCSIAGLRKSHLLGKRKIAYRLSGGDRNQANDYLHQISYTWRKEFPKNKDPSVVTMHTSPCLDAFKYT